MLNIYFLWLICLYENIFHIQINFVKNKHLPLRAGVNEGTKPLFFTFKIGEEFTHVGSSTELTGKGGKTCSFREKINKLHNNFICISV